LTPRIPTTPGNYQSPWTAKDLNDFYFSLFVCTPFAFIGATIILLFSCLIIFVVSLIIAASVTLIIVGAIPQRTLNIQKYSESLELKSLTKFSLGAISKNIIFEFSKISKVDRINDTTRNDELIPSYLPLQFQNASFPFLVNETFNQVDLLSISHQLHLKEFHSKTP
jgi:hypothetical protein